MHDPAGLRQLDMTGEHNVMWSVDYPHNEGPFGYTGQAVDYIVKTVGLETARKVLSETAIKFFRLS